MSASVQRVKACPGVGASAATTMPCTAACVTSTGPPSSSDAAPIETSDDGRDLPRPAAGHLHEDVGDEDPDGDPDGHLEHPASPLAVGHAEADDGDDRGEERRQVAEDVGREPPRHPGGDGALDEQEGP